MIILCSVCFSGSDPIIRDSLNAGIFVLLGVTGLVLGCFAYFFVQLARRSRLTASLALAEGDSLADDLLGAGSPARSYLR
jgi:hypothetical protein